MSKKLMHLALALVLTAAPLSAIAGMGAEENINIYGWQNWSYEFVDADLAEGGSREFDRLSNNAANIGFTAHMDTGIAGLQVGLRCEQFTYWGRLNNYTGWCNRNSKISLRHETMGELMFGQWLLPYNEIVAGWIDPFYDAGADSHTSIMGNIGGSASRMLTGNPDDDTVDRTFVEAGGHLSSLFYNGSFDKAGDFTSAFGALAFNRRQEGVIQYVWPTTAAMADQSRDGFQFRAAMTEGSGTDTTRKTSDGTLDPRIISTGVAWQQNLANGGQVWLAAAYEEHEDTSIIELGTDVANSCSDSSDEGIRLAGRYVHDWGNGQRTQFGAMWEELKYDADGCDFEIYRDVDEDEVVVSDDTDDRTDTYSAAWTDVEREAWMISGKHSFGNGFDFRFSYMDGDEWDCGNDNACTSDQEDGTDAEAYNLGVYYTMPAGTELRLTYSEVQNEKNAGYNFGIHGSGGDSRGEDIEMIAVGIVHWFD